MVDTILYLAKVSNRFASLKMKWNSRESLRSQYTRIAEYRARYTINSVWSRYRPEAIHASVETEAYSLQKDFGASRVYKKKKTTTHQPTPMIVYPVL